MAATHALPAPVVQRPRVLMIGTAFAAAASVMVFAGLIAIYLARRAEVIATSNKWLPEGVKIDLTQPNMMLFTLLASSIIVQWAVYAAARDDRRNLYLSLGLTFLFGFATINQLSYLYSLAKLDVSTTQQAVLIYSISGAHLVMMVAAMIFVLLMAFRALGGQETSRQHDGVSAAALYWHAMVAVYALIWITIYVTK